jgi:hypothetical protein
METKDKDILDIIDDGIQEAYRCFRIEEAKQKKPLHLIKCRSRQVAQY